MHTLAKVILVTVICALALAVVWLLPLPLWVRRAAAVALTSIALIATVDLVLVG
jgi:hypothetical protein